MDKIKNNNDIQRWLMSNGILTDIHKDNLFMYGSILHADIKAVEVDTDVRNKTIVYRIYLDKKMLKRYNTFHQAMQKGGIWNLWKAKRILKKCLFLDWEYAISQFIENYCGPNWKSSLSVLPVAEYDANLLLP